MFKSEARWLCGALDAFPSERLSPLLNLGSSCTAYRELARPWMENEVFRPLRRRGIEFAHVDLRDLPGVDFRADLTDPADIARLRALRPKALLCCNLLEHVTDPQLLAQHCLDMLVPGGIVFVTVPFSYPHHRDPIDTMFRPDPSELAALFASAVMLDGCILGAGLSYRDDVRARPWILLRHLARLPLPFLSLEKWKRSMAKLYWLTSEYRFTCAVFEKL